MNNTIEESYCSFEVSKLLKEKGFGIETYWAFVDTTPYSNEDKEEVYYTYKQNHNSKEHRISKPTHSLAIEWIRVNFKINIWVGFWRGGYKYETEILRSRELYNTPQEATEVALLYTLQNLI